MKNLKKFLSCMCILLLMCAMVYSMSFPWAADGWETTVDELAEIEGYGFLDEEIDYTDPLWDLNKMVYISGPRSKDTHAIPYTYIESLPKYGVTKGHHMVTVPNVGQDSDYTVAMFDAAEWIGLYKAMNFSTEKETSDSYQFFTTSNFKYNDYIRLRDLMKAGNYIFSYKDCMVLYDNVDQLIELMAIKSRDGYNSLGIYWIPDKTVAKKIADAINDGTINYRSEQFGSDKAVEDLVISDSTVKSLVDKDTALKNCGYGNSTSGSSDKNTADTGKGNSSTSTGKTDNKGNNSSSTGSSTGSSDNTTSGEGATKTGATTADGHTHVYTSTVIDKATCLKEGIMGWSCSCGDYYEEPIPALGHNFIEQETVEATCEVNGKTVYQCSVCGEKKEELIAATGHEWELTKDIDSTCSEEGVMEYTCKKCGATSAEEVALKDHVYVEVERLEPTCIANGRIIYRCEACGNEYEEVIQKIAHETELVVVKEPTFFKDGLAKEICKLCSEEVGEQVLPKTGFLPLWLCVTLAAVLLGGGVGTSVYLIKRKK